LEGGSSILVVETKEAIETLRRGIQELWGFQILGEKWAPDSAEYC